MKRIAIIVLISLLCLPLVAQEAVEKPTEWKLLGSQERELKTLLLAFQEAQLALSKALSEYREELKLIYTDMPANAEFNFDKLIFQPPPKKPEVKEKKEGK